MTNQKPSHTPIPWRRHGHWPRIEIRAGLTSLADIRLNGHNEMHGEANADFIVRACNNYEALLSALEECLPVIYRHAEDGAADRAEAAIAKAREGA